jgi:hypothetical protein
MGLRCFHVYYYDTDDNVLDLGRNSYALEIFNLKINVNKISHNKFLPKSMQCVRCIFDKKKLYIQIYRLASITKKVNSDNFLKV